MEHQMNHAATARCHCGNVEIGVTALPPSFTECNCSICRRYGAQWAYFRRCEVVLNAVPDSLTSYSWGDRTIEFYHCRHCGCVTHYESTEKQEDSRFAVNARIMPGELTRAVPIRRFDGAESWTYLD
jgi:hypothetical protein